MREVQVIRVKLSTAFLLITILIITTILVIITTVYALAQFHRKNVAEVENLRKLNEAINRLESTNDDVIASIIEKEKQQDN